MTAKSRYSRINAYHVMWIFVFFDLPTNTQSLRKKYAKFRKELMGDGFNMLQFSVYTRHCPSRENADVHINRIQSMTPKQGHVSIMIITDKQYSGIINILGAAFTPMKKAPGQLELF